jgi:hypothetical protein
MPTDVLSCKQALAVREYIPLKTADTTAAAASEDVVPGSVSQDPKP